MDNKTPTITAEELYQSVNAMPLMWTGSTRKWYAVYRSLRNAQTIALWHLRNRTGEAIFYGKDRQRIANRYGVKPSVEPDKYEMIPGRWRE